MRLTGTYEGKTGQLELRMRPATESEVSEDRGFMHSVLVHLVREASWLYIQSSTIRVTALSCAAGKSL